MHQKLSDSLPSIFDCCRHVTVVPIPKYSDFTALGRGFGSIGLIFSGPKLTKHDVLKNFCPPITSSDDIF